MEGKSLNNGGGISSPYSILREMMQRIMNLEKEVFGMTKPFGAVHPIHNRGYHRAKKN